MKKENIYKRALVFAIPMMIQNGITNGVSLVDNLMVGDLGTESMTGVSIAVQLLFVFSLAIFGGISGPGIYGAQYYGQGDTKGVQHVFRLKLWIGTVCSILGAIIFWFLGSELFQLYFHEKNGKIDTGVTLSEGLTYLHIMIIQLLPFAIVQTYASSLRETGDSVKPMIAGVASVIADVGLNYLLIYGKFGCPKLGVKGAAIATVMARFLELFLVILLTRIKLEKHEFLQGVYKSLFVPKNLVKSMIKKGFPIFINEFMWAAGLAVLTQCYSLRGMAIVPGLNISNSICNLLNVVFVAMGAAVGIIIGQYLGAGEADVAKKNSIKLMWFTGSLCLVLTAILIGISGQFPKLYRTSEDVRNYATRFIIVTAIFFPLQGFLNALYFTLRAGGKTVITLLFDSGFSWLVVVPVAFLLCRYTALPIIYVYAVIQALDFIKVCIGYVLVKKGIWINNLVQSETIPQ
ncbi:MAG: MATE family efflux transporter [Lachnospiraceae bacterium]|nr:MATE family efflux transporter [Lachnospiraceae bacterium]